MKRNILIALLLLAVFIPHFVMAKEAAKKAEEPPLVAEEECKYLIDYQPKADGSADYKPGVDVHGKSVVEADLSPPVVVPPEKYSFDITVDVAKRMGIHVPVGLMGEAKMGTVTIEKGKTTFNGKPLEGDAQAALRELCASQKAAPKPEAKPAPKAEPKPAKSTKKKPK